MSSTTTTQQDKPDFLLVRSDQAESYWQPEPANGHISIHLSPDIVHMETPFALGTQTVAPGCFVREHAHDDRDEVIHFMSGTGVAVVNDKEYEVKAGDTLFLGRTQRHKFIAANDTPLTFLWIMHPNGLEAFFKQIGLPREEDEPAPAPFPRPENIKQIERDTVFADLSDRPSKPQ